MRVLVLTHRLPYAPNRGDRIRSYHTLRTLVSRGCDVDLLSLVHDVDELARLEQVRALGVHVEAVMVPRVRNLAAAAGALLGPRPLTHVLLDAPGVRATLDRMVTAAAPDVVLAYCSGMARFAVEPPLASRPLVVDLVDIDSQKWRDLSQISTWPKRAIYAREARLLADFERQLGDAASRLIVVNDRERDLLRAVAPRAAVTVASNGIDVDRVRPRSAPGDSAEVVFCGVMDYEPNVDAVLWFCSEVWPLVRAARPDATFSVVGANPTSSVRRLQSSSLGISVTGNVDDVKPYLWRAAAAVAPLRAARGVQNKVLEAIGAGLPAVVTPAVWDGLPATVCGACRRAGSATDFANEVVSLLSTAPAARRQIAAVADLASITWDAQLRPLVEALHAATATARRVAV